MQVWAVGWQDHQWLPPSCQGCRRCSRYRVRRRYLRGLHRAARRARKRGKCKCESLYAGARAAVWLKGMFSHYGENRSFL